MCIFNEFFTDHEELINDDGPVEVMAHQVLVHRQGGAHLKWRVGKLCPVLTRENLRTCVLVEMINTLRVTSFVNWHSPLSSGIAL